MILVTFERSCDHLSVTGLNPIDSDKGTASLARLMISSPAWVRATLNSAVRADEEQTRFVLDRTGTEVAVVLAEPVTRAGNPARGAQDVRAASPGPVATARSPGHLVQYLRDSPGGDVGVVTIDAGHDVMISHPDELADALNEIASL